MIKSFIRCGPGWKTKTFPISELAEVRANLESDEIIGIRCNFIHYILKFKEQRIVGFAGPVSSEIGFNVLAEPKYRGDWSEFVAEIGSRAFYLDYMIGWGKYNFVIFKIAEPDEKGEGLININLISHKIL